MLKNTHDPNSARRRYTWLPAWIQTGIQQFVKGYKRLLWFCGEQPSNPFGGLPDFARAFISHAGLLSGFIPERSISGVFYVVI